MSTEKMREEFEAKYALPDGLYWCEQSGQYVGHPQFWLFTDRLEVWINSRAAIEVEWPDQHTYTAPDCAGAAILDCRTAFNKAVKVKP